MADRWAYLDPLTRRFLNLEIQAYNRILDSSQDIASIAQFYHLESTELERAKNYAFGDGVQQFCFIPDLDMAEAWQRLSQGQGDWVDQIFLHHELYESRLVWLEGWSQVEAHRQAEERYPWATLLKTK